MLRIETIETDFLIVGGGTAGCYAAITAARNDSKLRVHIVEKANIKRSGCLAAGVNAINAYITEGRTTQQYVDYARWDAEKIIRDDLVLSMAERFNEAAHDLERMGLVILKDENGKYVSRGKRNIKINGENIKPIIAREAKKYDNVSILNHVVITNLLQDGGRVCGAVGFSTNYETAWIISARAVLVATGGAAGLYRPNNPGFSRHKMWYPPFNAGAGYALGIRVGAEMTSFEMRFVAQRIKDTIAPTGTIALGVGASEVNALGEAYAERYGLTTSGRARGATKEVGEGRGPCYLKTVGLDEAREEDLYKAYLNMAPAQTLKWIESGERPSIHNVEIEGTEPYVVGGHTASGYWIDTKRRSTVPGLYAAGDVAGGAPKKFVTGALAEGWIAAETVAEDIDSLPPTSIKRVVDLAKSKTGEYERRFGERRGVYDARELEEAMQKVMDVYAGGISVGYRYNESQLAIADEKIDQILELANGLAASDVDELVRVYELIDRATVCKTLLAHLRGRKETRWPGFGVFADYPEKDDAFECFVNTRNVDGKIQTITRPLMEGVTYYEHSH